MELSNEFVIDRPVEETWEILNDLEFIAPCMPGAQLQEIEGDEYRGIVKIKVGPITAQYKGKASFIEQDAEKRVARLKAEGRDPRQGNANAIITATMEAVGEAQTSVNIHTDLGLSGKLASFGRGAIEDVSKKILGQFTENLREKLEEGADTDESSAPEASVSEGSTDSTASSEGSNGPADNGATGTGAAATSSVRTIDGPEADPVDLLAVSGPSMAKRLFPAAGGLAIVAIILYWLLGRG